MDVLYVATYSTQPSEWTRSIECPKLEPRRQSLNTSNCGSRTPFLGYFQVISLGEDQLKQIDTIQHLHFALLVRCAALTTQDADHEQDHDDQQGRLHPAPRHHRHLLRLQAITSLPISLRPLRPYKAVSRTNTRALADLSLLRTAPVTFGEGVCLLTCETGAGGGQITFGGGI